MSTYSFFTTSVFLQPLRNAHLSLYIIVSFIAEKMFIGGEIIYFSFFAIELSFLYLTSRLDILWYEEQFKRRIVCRQIELVVLFYCCLKYAPFDNYYEGNWIPNWLDTYNQDFRQFLCLNYWRYYYKAKYKIIDLYLGNIRYYILVRIP